MIRKWDNRRATLRYATPRGGKPRFVGGRLSYLRRVVAEQTLSGFGRDMHVSVRQGEWQAVPLMSDDEATTIVLRAHLGRRRFVDAMLAKREGNERAWLNKT